MLYSDGCELAKGAEKTLVKTLERTLRNCKFYENENDSLHLLNEIGVLRGLLYALEVENVDYDISGDIEHWIIVQNLLLIK